MTDEQRPDDRKPIERLHLWEFQALRDGAVIAAVVGLLWLGYLLSIVTVPLLVALGLAYLVEPLIAWITRAVPRLSRTVVVAGLMVVMGLIFALGLLLTVPALVKEATQLVKNRDRYVAQMRSFASAHEVPDWLRSGLGTLTDLLPQKPPLAVDPEPEGVSSVEVKTTTVPTVVLDETRVRALIREELANQPRPDQPGGMPSGFLQGVAGASLRVLGYLGAIAGGLVQVGIFAVTCGFCFFVFATSFPAVVSFGRGLVPASGQQRWFDLIAKMDRALSGFVRGRLTICVCLGVMYAVGWVLCGVPHGMLLGLAVGLCSLVPYLSVIGLPLAWVLLAVSLAGVPVGDRAGFYFAPDAQGMAAILWWKVLLMPAIVNGVAQAIEDWVLNPLIQGKATNLHPVVILLAAIAGGSLLGLYGMILAVPIAACLKIVIQEVIMPKVRDWLAGRAKDPLPG